ncbi:hypothetical protein N0V88_007238 [Collariella sp. IMI 366227]|nr:hypothetical protein N0V88_007238 [Collariella sp. IMI 366227]
MPNPNPKGGNLFDMAKEGTKVPPEASQPNISKKATGGGLEGAPGNTGMADNPLGSTSLGEVFSAGGGELPEDVGNKYSRSGGKERGEHEEKGEHRHHHTPHGGGICLRIS